MSSLYNDDGDTNKKSPSDEINKQTVTLADLMKEIESVETMGTKKSISSLFKLVYMAVEVIAIQEEKIKYLHEKLDIHDKTEIISCQEEKIRHLQEKLAVHEEQIGEVHEKLDGPKKSPKGKDERLSYAAVATKGLSVTGRVVLEMSKLETKKNNIIIRGVKESKKSDLKERNKEDMASIMKIIEIRDTGLDAEQIEPMIEYSTRLGKNNPEYDHRPILVKLKDKSIREKLLEAKGNTKLREFNITNGTKYRVEPDLTIEQRQYYNNLWTEASAKTSEGNGQWVVYGPMDNPHLKKWKREKTMTSQNASKTNDKTA